MMRFADTSYFLALLNPNDEAHFSAMEQSQGPGGILTTEWVLTELGDALASHTRRQRFLELCRLMTDDENVTIVRASTDSFQRGVQLFAQRSDKDWSLTDCISFLVMRDYGITEALTGDHHFEQAGFVALLRGPTR